MKTLEKYWTFIIILFGIFIFIKPIVCSLILGLIFCVVCLDYLRVYRILKKNGTLTVGKIKKYTRGWKGFQTPTINFSTTNGELIETEPYFYASSDINKIRTFKNYTDQNVEIKYNPEKPTEFLIASQQAINLISVYLFLLVGLFFTSVGILDILQIITVKF